MTIQASPLERDISYVDYKVPYGRRAPRAFFYRTFEFLKKSDLGPFLYARTIVVRKKKGAGLLFCVTSGLSRWTLARALFSCGQK